MELTLEASSSELMADSETDTDQLEECREKSTSSREQEEAGTPISRHSPDVVLLQELIQPYTRFMKKRLAEHYTFMEGLNHTSDPMIFDDSIFDRLYLRRAGGDGIPPLEPEGMALIGLEKLKCGRFTSDQWGIYCTFSAQ